MEEENKVCSQGVYDILVAFNNLSSLAEQEEILDAIYEALHKKVIREVTSERLIRQLKDENKMLAGDKLQLETENEELKRKLENIRKNCVAKSEKKLKLTIRAEYLVLTDIKRHLGPSWEEAFPDGGKAADAILKTTGRGSAITIEEYNAYLRVKGAKG